MPKSFEEIAEKSEKVYRSVKTIHLDVMDGTLSHPRSWPFSPPALEEFQKIASGEIPLPHWKEVDYEVDVMMKNPEDSFAEWVNAGFHRVIVHIESTEKFISILHEWKGVVEIGAAINIDTPVSELSRVIHDGVDFVQLMGIGEIGFQGTPFDDRVIEKVASLREEYPELIISVDGGVSLENAPLLIKAGANRLVAGSAIFSIKNHEVAHTPAPSSSEDNLYIIEDITEIDKAATTSVEGAISSFKDIARKTAVSATLAKGPIDIKLTSEKK